MHDIMRDITSQKVLPTACPLARMCYKAYEIPKVSPKAHYNNNRLRMHMFWSIKRSLDGSYQDPSRTSKTDLSKV